jgi:hypothetical protein
MMCLDRPGWSRFKEMLEPVVFLAFLSFLSTDRERIIIIIRIIISTGPTYAMLQIVLSLKF